MIQQIISTKPHLNTAESPHTGLWLFAISQFNAGIHYWFHWIGMRPHGWAFCFANSRTIAQLTLSSVKLCLSFSKLVALMLYVTRLLLLFNVFYVSKMCLHSTLNKVPSYFNVKGILYFCYQHVSSHWNPVSVSYWKCIAVFVMILWVPINQEHWASAVCFRIFVSKSSYSLTLYI